MNEETMPYGHFGREMRQYRECNLWTLDYVATRIGYGIGVVVSIERGIWQPEVKFVNRWCKFIGCSEDERRVWHQHAARSHGWRI